MSEAPFFSILIPTKNRAHLVGYAIRSVLQQDFEDFEIVVCDNDDDETTTRQVVEDFIADERVKYIRTGGLDMVANWNRALDAATGRHITVLEDKMIFYPGALAAIHEKIAQSPSGVVVWNTDRIQDRNEPARLLRFVPAPDRILSSDKVLDLLVTDIMRYWLLLPRGLSCVVPREFIDRVVAKDGKEFYEAASPDFVSAMKVIDTVDSYLQCGDAYSLITSNKGSNGKVILHREGGTNVLKYYGEKAASALKCRHVPVDSKFIVVNMVVNDYRSLAEREYFRLRAHPVSDASYVKMMTRELLGTTLATGRVVWSKEEVRQLWCSEGGYFLNFTRMLMAAGGLIMELLLRRLRQDKAKVMEPLPEADLNARIERFLHSGRA